MMTVGNTNISLSSIFDIITKTSIPLIAIVWTTMTATVDKMDERFWQLQKESVSKQEMQAMKQELLSMMELKLGTLNVKQDMTNQQLTLIYQQMKEQQKAK